MSFSKLAVSRQPPLVCGCASALNFLNIQDNRITILNIKNNPVHADPQTESIVTP
ncbi:hypothetical protein AB76_5373 [Escherichia coli 3-267-03_S1_C3]|nr:hypothetical protein AB76_5373 [Escherichia coli 3-267-03_S1_C3]